ncbi:Sucrose-6-phosphate hydrolase [Corynebacterium capitovis DSM 44611]|nr:Sucrose-6-phosphate hydrolase [Corynebacterium capitovis DSM 44611]
MFYQHDPGHEEKRVGWGHAVTTLDGGPWAHLPDALSPSFPYDRDGCYPGSALVDEGSVRVYYTGVSGAGSERRSSQNLVEVEDIDGPAGGFFHRSPANPLVDVPGLRLDAGPYVTCRPGGQWRMVVGGQRDNGTGAVALLTSTDGQSWEEVGPLEFAGLNYNVASAHAWERPNLLSMVDEATGESSDVLVFSPRFPDSDESGYVVGHLEGTNFDVVTDYTPLDYGHEFFGPHLVVADGAALMLGWMGQPSRGDTPSLEAEGWAHQLTLPRRVVLRGGRLYQSLLIPRDARMCVGRFAAGSEPFNASLVDATGATPLTVSWNPTGDGRGTVSVTKNGLTRWAECGEGEVLCTADGAAVEITAGGGEVAFSAAVFAADDADWEGFALD